MKNIVMFLSMLMLAGSANATVIDFDTYSNSSSGNGELLGDEYISSGIEFSTSGLALNIGATTGSGPNSLGADSNSVNDFDGDITIQFTSGFFVDDLSFLIFNTPYLASAFDVFGNLLTTLTGTGFSTTFDFSGFDVNRVDISGDFYAIDDVSFGELHSGNVVPAPTSLLLLITGLIALRYFKKVD
ncbi:hypothetical protein ACFL2V_02975 [Pseudomonadota bacterium]